MFKIKEIMKTANEAIAEIKLVFSSRASLGRNQSPVR